MNTRRLFIIRHAEAQCGPSKMDRDFFLTDTDQEQAHALGRELKRLGVKPSRIYSSQPEPDATVLIVAHGSFLAAMLTDMLQLPLRPVWNISMANASFLVVRLHGGPAPETVLPVLSTFCPCGDANTGMKRSEALTTDRGMA